MLHKLVKGAIPVNSFCQKKSQMLKIKIFHEDKIQVDQQDYDDHTTVDGPLEITVFEEIGKMKERIEKQEQIIEDFRNKQTSRADRETTEVNCQANFDDNFQQQTVHSKRKRVECDAPNVQGSLSQQQDTSRCTVNKTREQVTQNKIPRHVNSKKARPSAMAVGTTVVLKSTKYPNKEDVAYATLLSCDPNAQVGGIALGNLFWKACVIFPMEDNEVLVRPWHSFKTIGDAKGKSIAWPSTFVEKVNG